MNDTLIRTLDRGRLQILLLVADLPDDHLALQPSPGMNHPAWVLGHLAILDVITTDALQGHPAQIAPHIRETYGTDSSPTADRSRYLPKSQLIRNYDDGRLELLNRLAQTDSMTLDNPTPDPTLRRAFPTLAHLLLYTIWHDGHHGGQLSTWRRAQSLPNPGLSFFTPDAHIQSKIRGA
jgi:uncharacterized damage-inducible protein DinB